jgi:hypothetical protein
MLFMNAVFNKYISNMAWAYRSNPSQVNSILFTGNAKVNLPNRK